MASRELRAPFTFNPEREATSVPPNTGESVDGMVKVDNLMQTDVAGSQPSLTNKQLQLINGFNSNFSHV